MMIKSYFVGERIMAFTIVFNSTKELTCNDKKVINVTYQGWTKIHNLIQGCNDNSCNIGGVQEYMKFKILFYFFA
jgi:hypothetical protein